MLWKNKKEDDFETKKEMAIETITVVYNNVQENKRLCDALAWAIDVLKAQRKEKAKGNN